MSIALVQTVRRWALFSPAALLRKPASCALPWHLSGLLTGCLSYDPELTEMRSPPPTFVTGRLEGGPQECAGSLVRGDKVLTLERCVEGAEASDLSFVVDGERRRNVAAIGRDPAALIDLVQSAAENDERQAMLTLSSQLDGPAWSTIASAPEGSPLWLNTIAKSGPTPRLLACSRSSSSGEPLDCGPVERWPGALVFAVNENEPVAVGIDRGRDKPLLGIDQSVPDRPTDIALSLENDFGRLELKLFVAVPDWNRIVEGRSAWNLEFETEFSPLSVSFFDWEGELASVLASAEGAVFLQREDFEALVAPVKMRRVKALSDDEIVLWALGQSGELCRKLLWPERRGWRCGATVMGATTLAVLRVEAAELVAVSSDQGVTSFTFAADEFGELEPWALAGMGSSAVTLGRLQSGRADALAATLDGELWLRTLDAPDAWSAWSLLNAGTLPTPVEALHGGHIPGWPEEIYALAGGRLHYTIESVPRNGETDAGAVATPARFEDWQ
jgi:hypothetical protein